MGVVLSNGLCYLAVGIACLVISLQHPTQCGVPGFPPLQTWVFATGIAYTIIGGVNSLFGILLLIPGVAVVAVIPVIVILICAGAFTFAWMIVGAVSLWRDGGDCMNLNFTIWQMGMAAVIISIVMVVFSGISTRSAQNNENR